MGSSAAPPSLPGVLANLPAGAAGVLLSRFEFSSGTRTLPHPTKLEVEAYTHRACVPLTPHGKYLWRTDAVATSAGLAHWGGHGLQASTRQAIVWPDGSPACRTNRSCRGGGNGSFVALARSRYNATTGAPLTRWPIPLRLHHYSQRSTAECHRKEAAALELTGSGFAVSTWREKLVSVYAMSACSAPLCVARDLTLAQFAPAIRAAVSRLFGDAAFDIMATEGRRLARAVAAYAGNASQVRRDEAAQER